VDVPEDERMRAPGQVSIEALLERATLRDAELDEERDRMEAVNNKVDCMCGFDQNQNVLREVAVGNWRVYGRGFHHGKSENS
jgi:hypothetical protein